MVRPADDSGITGSADARVDQSALQELILSTQGMTEFLDELVQLAAAGHGPCAITVRLDDKSRTVASSDALAARVDEIQYAQGEGPCLEAMRTGTVVYAPDLAGDDRWGNYRSYALAQGVRSVLSNPLGVEGQHFGALNMYSTEANGFDDAAREQAERWAQQASGAVGVALRLAERTRHGQQLAEALDSRSIIDQAIGILMAQQRCSSGVAFEILRSASQGRNVKLRTIAADIVRAVGGEPADDNTRG
ncbi:GAF and ANTAR domain-containing protein [Blastococcus saxobsidens]|uniref:Putative Response regulator with antiterminator output domain n=1 Tax=Blastococcus saxobsidens (strain DD2) TaxID=1146883 RepID=H6RU79_BLASD|nr:GAF and ANTAR domain-containing protein [Blastococcus saxobsidens]CCG05686.1 putative Response regulator with antiterminator output domain [Blastococcus saxobsidens DD2]